MLNTFHSVAVHQCNANLILSVLTLLKNNRKGDCKNVNGKTSEGFPLQETPLINIIIVFLLLHAITEV